MASLETIRLITIQGKTVGVDEATDSLKKLSDAQDNVAIVSEKSSKSTLSAQSALDRQQRSLDTTYRSNQQYNKAVSDLERAHAQGLTTLDQHNRLMQLASDKYGQGSVTSKAFGAAIGGIQGQLVALSAGAGPVGVFLSGLGPWGLAAAIGIGAAEKAFGAMSAASHEFAQKARELKDFAESTGLTINQLKAFDTVGASVGVSSERVAHGLEGMTSKLEEFRNAQGPAFDLLYKYNSGLATQLVEARGTTDAINILSKAFVNLDTVQRNTLGRALGFGRAPGDMIRLLSASGSAPATTERPIDENMARRVAELDIQIEQASKRMRNNIVSIFARDVLESELTFYNTLLLISDTARDFKVSPGLLDVIGIMALGPIGWLQAAGKMVGKKAAEAAFPTYNGAQSVDESGFSMTKWPSAPTVKVTPQASLNLWEKQNSVLGSAMTLTEQYDQKVLQLAAAQDKDKFSNENRTRALQAFMVTQIGAQELQIRTTLGIVTADDIRKQKLAELGLHLDKIKASESDRARALEIETVAIEKDIEAIEKQKEVRASALPGLAAMAYDSGNLRTQLDLLATSSMSNITTHLADITMGTVTASQGFKNLALAVLRSLDEMLIKMLIILPIANALKDAMGLGIFTGANPMPNTVPGSGPFPSFAAGGIVGRDMPGIGYMSAGAFAGARSYDSGGMVGGGGVPIIAHQGERVLNAQQTSAYDRGGGNITISPTIVIQGGATQADNTQADMIGKSAAAAMRSMVRDEIRQQQRPRGLLN